MKLHQRAISVEYAIKLPQLFFIHCVTYLPFTISHITFKPSWLHFFLQSVISVPYLFLFMSKMRIQMTSILKWPSVKHLIIAPQQVRSILVPLSSSSLHKMAMLTRCVLRESTRKVEGLRRRRWWHRTTTACSLARYGPHHCLKCKVRGFSQGSCVPQYILHQPQGSDDYGRYAFK